MGWSTKWPHEPGWYWFYGSPWVGGAFRLCAVNANRGGDGKVMCVTNGHFLYREQATGYWMPLSAPELPPVELGAKG